MVTMSVVDILRKHGKWIETKKFVNVVAEQLSISDRHAYRKIKQAWKDKQIKKQVLPDRSVLCGLPEFGPISKKKATLNFQDAFFYDCFKKLEEINDMAAYGPDKILIPQPEVALTNLKYLIARLPKEIKDKLEADEKKALEYVAKSKDQYQASFKAVKFLTDKVSTLLHEQIKGGEKPE